MERRDFSRAVTAAKIDGALAPEVLLLVLLESSETVRQIPIHIGKDTVRTARRRAEGGRNVHSASEAYLSG